MNITSGIAALVAAWGSYYEANPNAKRLVDTFYRSMSPFSRHTKKIATEDTVYRRAKALVSELLQAYQGTFVAKGNFTAEPFSTELHHVGMDVEITEAEIESLTQSWLGFLTEIGDQSMNYPFVRYVMEMHLREKYQEDFTLNTYSAVRGTITPGVATAASASFHGVKKRLNDWITATVITPIATGAFDADNKLFYKQLVEFHRDIPQLYRMRPMVAMIDEDHMIRALEGADLVENTNYMKMTVDNQAGTQALEYPVLRLKGTNTDLVGVPMGGEQKVITTLRGNFLEIRKRQLNVPRLHQDVKSVKATGQEWVAFDFDDPRKVFTNDRNLV